MTPAQYLAACKTKLGHVTDYELAKRWQIDDGYMSKIMRGKRPINAHIAVLIAVTLEQDPVTVLAEIESQQQTGKVQEFWKSFLLHARATSAVLLCMLPLMLSGGTESAQAGTGGLRIIKRKSKAVLKWDEPCNV